VFGSKPYKKLGGKLDRIINQLQTIHILPATALANTIF